jgi:hypothetical protein
MSIRIRKIQGHTVALCAAKTNPEIGDIYLDDNAHYALSTKFMVDFESTGHWVDPPVDETVKALMLKAEVSRSQRKNDLAYHYRKERKTV